MPLQICVRGATSAVVIIELIAAPDIPTVVEVVVEDNLGVSVVVEDFYKFDVEEGWYEITVSVHMFCLQSQVPCECIQVSYGLSSKIHGGTVPVEGSLYSGQVWIVKEVQVVESLASLSSGGQEK